ncbi:MAG: purine-nucleoside phosphorylase [Legionellales bacterium]|nr:purine-nucleoside phosphorylase [Legionellales bacterium]
MSLATAQSAVEFIHQHAPDFTPQLSIILGSGLTDVTADMDIVAKIDYRAIPGFPKPTVKGHSGQLILGYLQELPIAVLQGRTHYYEHKHYDPIKLYIHTLKQLNCRDLLITGASGSLNEDITPGELVLIADHINWQLPNPLLGPNDDTIGPRFPDLTFAYDPHLRELFMACAKQTNLSLSEGVYLATSGPTYETAAEIHAFRMLGADAVGMSIVPEVIIANHCGLRVAAFACITNFATGLTATRHQHQQILSVAEQCSQRLRQLLANYININY